MPTEKIKSTIPCHINDEVVISGISGRFPESNNIEEFKQQLLQGVDLVTDDDRRWPSGLYTLPARCGKLKNLTHFDANFFGIHPKMAEVTDPQQRLLLEATFEAILDAGINPAEIRGSRTGVYIAVSESESSEFFGRDVEKTNKYGLTGCSKTLLANRISYTFGFTGPSYTIDSACSSTLVALKNSVDAIQSGECDAAVIGGCNLCLNPKFCLQFHQLNLLSLEGKCRSFDSKGTGYVRSECVGTIYIQRSNTARRVYATILGVRLNNDGYKERGITVPSRKMQGELLQELYHEYNINPDDIEYVETHGTGTSVGDPEEGHALANGLCQNRKTPLLIGSVKSNMGHAESASGICSLAKVIIAMECGTIPGNLHFENPNPNIPGLLNGSLKVVSKNQPYNGGLVGVSSFGIGGVNAHVVLRPNRKPKAPSSKETIPRLVVVSGRTELAVNRTLQNIENHKADEEFLALLNQIHAVNVSGHEHRGYSILGSTQIEVAPVKAEKRPIWFVYSGMGSQWSGMAKQMMQLEPFKNSIMKSADILIPHGVDLVHLLVNAGEVAFDNILNIVVSITAMQIALTDVLKDLGIEPDGMVGHSTGEIGCGYADGNFTLEQSIMAAYCRGRAVMETTQEHGGMVTVGLTWEECEKRCPPGIFPVCHNSESSVTVSGPTKKLLEFVKQLDADNIFFKFVKGSAHAFHCKYVADAGPILMKALERVIPYPKARSSKWISSSVPEEAWNTPLGQFNSPQYGVNNLLSPVLFYQAVQHIPENAIVIEIAPHGLLLPAVKRSLGPNATHCSLMEAQCSDSLHFLLTNIGRLYNAGANPIISRLYNPVPYPVGRGTTMISPLIEWDHSVNWTVADFSKDDAQTGKHVVTIDVSKEVHQYLTGHKLEGRVFFPAPGYVVMAWKTLAKLKQQDFEKLPVVLENIHFRRAVFLPKNGPVRFSIAISQGTGEFEIYESDSIIVTGRIFVPEDIDKEHIQLSQRFVIYEVTKDDIYKTLQLCGYDYAGVFQGIVQSNMERNEGKLNWEGNWVSFFDTMAQFFLFSQNINELHLPIGIDRVVINPILHNHLISQLPQDDHIPISWDNNLSMAKSGGIEIRGLRIAISQRRHQTTKLDTYEFVPLDNQMGSLDSQLRALTITFQIIVENSGGVQKFKTVEVASEMNLTISMQGIIERIPNLWVDYTVLNPSENDVAVLKGLGIKHLTRDIASGQFEQNAHLVILVGHSKTPNVLKNAMESLKPNGFLLAEEYTSNIDASIYDAVGLQIVCSQTVSTTSKTYMVLRRITEPSSNPTVLEITERDFSWVEPLKSAMKRSESDGSKIYLFSQSGEPSGLIGMVNCLKQEPGGNNIRSYFIQSNTAKTFDLSSEFYSAQIAKDLVHNVLNRNTKWGTFRQLSFEQNSDSSHQLEHAYINNLNRGDLSSLTWIERPPVHGLANQLAHCTVYYAALNYVDLMLATGKPIHQTNDMGFEISGLDCSGSRVMGLVSGRGLATTCIPDSELLWKVPKNWSLEEAATVPAAYAMAYYALIIRGHILAGDSILIHTGSSGIGLAAISVSLHLNCNLFITVENQENKDWIKNTFPQLDDKRIGNSYSGSFVPLIMGQTQGRGADVVLNCVARRELQASVQCLAAGGRYLEVGEIDESLSVNTFLNNNAFYSCSVSGLLRVCSSTKKAVYRLVNEGISQGCVTPLPRTIFTADKVEEAFRLLQSSVNVGKILLRVREDDGHSQKLQITVMGVPRTYMDPCKVYILIGGLGGFGLELANWLVLRGATAIVLNSRNGIQTSYQSLCMEKFRRRGVKLLVSTVDVSTYNGAMSLIDEAKTLGPIGGIFNLALVLSDALMENQTEETFKIVTKPKIDVTKHLDTVSRRFIPDLDYFVVFSSAASTHGYAGGANYGLANSAIENICENRRFEGLPGLAILWGPVGDVGIFIRKMGDNDTEKVGLLPQRMHSCLATMDVFLKQTKPIVSSVVLSSKDNKPASGTPTNPLTIVCKMLGIKDIANASHTKTLLEFGMDSLMVSEIKQTLEQGFNLMFSVQEVRLLTLGFLSELPEKVEFDIKQSLKSGINARVKKGNAFDFNAEIMPSDVIIQMSECLTVKDPIFVIHSIEGNVDAMVNLSKLLDAPVYGLQWTKSCPTSSISEIAQFYITHIKTVQHQGPYVILGWSFGSCIAFEIGLQLESRGDNVKLLLLDGSHSYTTKYATNMREKTARKQTEALINFAIQFQDFDTLMMLNELLGLKTLEERVSQTAAMLSSSLPYSLEDIEAALAGFYYKLVTADSYKPSRVFQGDVILVKFKHSAPAESENYDLDKVCEKKNKIYVMDKDVRSILKGESIEKLANILTDILITNWNNEDVVAS